jgi:hypothetical protein
MSAGTISTPTFAWGPRCAVSDTLAKLLRALEAAIDRSDPLTCFEEQIRVARGGR